LFIEVDVPSFFICKRLATILQVVASLIILLLAEGKEARVKEVFL
jgi:hypothetical protein